MHALYIDDLTEAEAVNLQKQLVNISSTEVQHPLSFHERTGHVRTETGLLQKRLDEIEQVRHGRRRGAAVFKYYYLYIYF